MLLGVDLLLEFHAFAHLHKFVGIAGVAVFAGKLASAIRIDGPGKRHTGAGASVQQRPYRQGEIFDLVPLPDALPVRSQPGNAD
jgi:hypothetical protein